MKNRRTARKVNHTAQAEKASPPDKAAAAPPPYRPCRVWFAYTGERGFHRDDPVDGLLVTEADNLDGLVAYINTNVNILEIGKPLDWSYALDMAGRIVRDADAISREPATRQKVIDLRQYGRWWSVDPTPAWLYGYRVRPAEGTLAELAREMVAAVDLDPFCPIRLAKEVEKFTRLRWPNLNRAALPVSAVGIAERREDDGDGIDGDCRFACVRRVDDYPGYWSGRVVEELAAARAQPIAEALDLINPAAPHKEAA